MKRVAARAVSSRAWRASASIGLLALAAACGGGGGDNGLAVADSQEPVEQVDPSAPPAEDTPPIAPADPSNPTPSPADPTTPAPVGETPLEPAAALTGWLTCTRVPAASTATGRVRLASEFGAVPNDGRDDAVAIQKALDSLSPGDTLAFAAGRYDVDRSLKVRRPGITLKGADTTLHATDPDDMALQVLADDTTVASLTFTAVTDGRRTAPRHARIAVTADLSNGYRTVKNVVIRDNRIVNAGAPGTATANASSASGIFVQNAENFLIARNTVQRTLADGIHITAGSRRGRVLDNVVRETGDDMIAVVSYADGGASAVNSAAGLLASWDVRAEQRLARNILIAGNQVSSPYWGRGISVVGGKSVTIARNTLTNMPRAAAILVAREANYSTFGVENVWVTDNVLRDVQTGSPTYDAAGRFSTSSRTGHGGIEIHASLFEDEAANATMRDRMSIRKVLVRGNQVEHSAVAAVRAGVKIGGSADGRTVVAGYVQSLDIEGNRFDDTAREPISVLQPERNSTAVYCGANQRDGTSYSNSACKGRSQAITGATLACQTDGRLL